MRKKISKVLVLGQQSSLDKQIAELLKQEGCFNDFYINKTKNAQQLLARFKFSFVLFKIKNIKDENWITLLESISEQYKTPLVYLLDNSMVKSFPLMELPTAHAIVSLPINEFSFRSIVNILLREEKEYFEKYTIEVKQNRSKKAININQIDWVSAKGNYCYISSNSHEYVIRITIKKLLQQLPSDNFIQVHRSYLIDVSKIESINMSKQIVRIKEAFIPIGRKYKNDLLEKLNII